MPKLRCRICSTTTTNGYILEFRCACFTNLNVFAAYSPWRMTVSASKKFLRAAILAMISRIAQKRALFGSCGTNIFLLDCGSTFKFLQWTFWLLLSSRRRVHIVVLSLQRSFQRFLVIASVPVLTLTVLRRHPQLYLQFHTSIIGSWGLLDTILADVIMMRVTLSSRDRLLLDYLPRRYLSGGLKDPTSRGLHECRSHPTRT